MSDIKSMAEFKRSLYVGQMLTFENFRFPDLSGEREVLRVQTQQLATRLPVGHPRYDEIKDRGSWLDFPKAVDASFEGRTLTVSKRGELFCKITVPE